MSQNEQEDIRREGSSESGEHSIEEERAGGGDDLVGDQDAEPPTADGREPDPAQLDPDASEPGSHPDPDPDAR